MSHLISDHMEIPYSDSDEYVARFMLSEFGYEPEDRREDPPANVAPIRPEIFDPDFQELVVKFTSILAAARSQGKLTKGDLGEELWRHLYELGWFWSLDLDRDWPSGPYPEQDAEYWPTDGSAADFMYVALMAVGIQFSNRNFRQHFLTMRRKLAIDVGYQVNDEGDDP